MTGYTKLFSSIITSTIWRADNATRIVWITMLALRDRNHVVEASVPGLADMARVSVEDCRKALVILSAFDPDSRTKEHGGRRVEQIDGGWIILNGEKYRKKMNIDERREYKRQKQSEYRKQAKMLNRSGQVLPMLTQTESESETYITTMRDEIDETKTSAGIDPASQLSVALGIQNNVNDKLRGELRRLISIAGYEEAEKAMRYAVGVKKLGCPACIHYAEKMVISDKAKRDDGPSKSKPLTGPRVRE